METLELTRNRAQERALQALYGVLTYIDMKQPVDVEDIVSGVTQVPYEQSDIFVKKIVIEAIRHINEIIPIYEKNMRKWTFSRLNRVEQALLLLSYTHYYYVETTVDKGVTIDVAVKLAKLYLDANDYKFVNAILDKVLNRDGQ